MTTYANELPTTRDFLAAKLHSLLINRRANRVSKPMNTSRVTVVLNATIRVVLHLAGFGLLTMAGFTFSMLAGLITAGLSCFVLSTLMTRNTTGESEVNRAPDLRTGR
jgi:hypothetical protein